MIEENNNMPPKDAADSGRSGDRRLSTCSASSDGRTIYEADCKKRPNYHDGKPRKTWEDLGEEEQWSWNRPAVMLMEGDDLGNLQPDLQHLCDDGTWKESSVKNGKMTKFLVGHYRLILLNVKEHAPTLAGASVGTEVKP